MSHQANIPAFLPIRRIPLRSATEISICINSPRESQEHIEQTCKLQIVPSINCKLFLLIRVNTFSQKALQQFWERQKYEKESTTHDNSC